MPPGCRRDAGLDVVATASDAVSVESAPLQAATEELSDVVRAAAMLVPKVARLIDRCTSESDPGRELARACGEISSIHVALQLRLEVLPRTSLVLSIERLLNYQLQILRQASALAFRPRDHTWYRLAAGYDSWGDPADEIIRLAARLCSAAPAQ
jgi:hypothetical protein